MDEGPLSVEDHILSALSARAPQTSQQSTSLPVATLPEPLRGTTLYFVVTTIDRRGRLADRSPLRTLGWSPDCTVTISTVGRVVVVVTRSAGPDAITRQGYLRLPARVRHVCRLDTGARLLVAASADRDLLVAYPASSVETSLLAYHKALGHRDVR